MLEHENLLFEFAAEPRDESRLKGPLAEQLTEFREFGKETRVIQTQSQTLNLCLALTYSLIWLE